MLPMDIVRIILSYHDVDNTIEKRKQLNNEFLSFYFPGFYPIIVKWL
jgi:hypothetical protein